MKPTGKFHEYLLKHADDIADLEAIVHPRCTMTYGQLKEAAMRLADSLLALGLKRGDRVVLDFDPCPEAIAMFAACSIAGAVFVPVSPEMPQSRVERIIEMTSAKLYIQGEPMQRQLPSTLPVVTAVLDGNDRIRPVHSGGTPAARGGMDVYLDAEVHTDTEANDLAYIIFTSGTTGIPKGIMMSHAAVVAFFEGMAAACKVPAGMRIGTIAPLQFDFALLDMGLAFGAGSTLVQMPRQLAHHPARMMRFLREYRIGQMNGVPSIWRPILQAAIQEADRPTELEAILYAGEHFPPADLNRMKASFPSLRRIWNGFGQSESIACSFIDIYDDVGPDMETATIGYGQPGAELLLIDEAGRLIAEPGVRGELYLGGPLLFSGYWQAPKATSAALVPHPLRPESGERVFRTGDLAYLGTAGELYYVGRKDMQVQLFGNRVEPAEIESRIALYPTVSDAAIVVAEEAGESPRLWAAVVMKEGHRLDAAALRAFVAEALPAYMLPSRIEAYGSLPVTVNGKTDRKALLERMMNERMTISL